MLRGNRLRRDPEPTVLPESPVRIKSCLLAAAAFFLAMPSTHAADAITGTAAYRERIALPSNAVFEAMLEDISRSDAKAETIASVRLEGFGQVPVRFEMPYDAARIDQSHRYSVRGRILIDGRLAWTTDQAYPVITGGHPSQVELLLRKTGGTPRPASGAVQLEGAYWKLTHLGESAVPAFDPRREPHLILAKDQQRVSGAGGCNRITGSYQLDGDKLSFGKMAATMMACVDAMDVEQVFLKALGEVARFKLDGGELVLLDAQGTALAKLVAQAPKPK
jgi:putative lipoprotein